jgi:hypothetical protein
VGQHGNMATVEAKAQTHLVSEVVAAIQGVHALEGYLFHRRVRPTGAQRHTRDNAHSTTMGSPGRKSFTTQLPCIHKHSTYTLYSKPAS